MHTYLYTPTHIQAYVHTYMHTHPHAQSPIQSRTYIHNRRWPSSIYTYMYICIYIYIIGCSTTTCHNRSGVGPGLWQVRKLTFRPWLWWCHIHNIAIERISSIYRRRESRNELGLLTSSSARLFDTRSISVSRRVSRSGISLPPHITYKNKSISSCMHL